MIQTSLFDFVPDPNADRYPRAPGHRNVETSVAAAHYAKPTAATVRQMVLEAVRSRRQTSFELARSLRIPYETLQPRTSELKAQGLIKDSGLRGPSRNPKVMAIVWEAA